MRRALALFLKAGGPLSSIGSSQEEGPFLEGPFAGSQAFSIFMPGATCTCTSTGLTSMPSTRPWCQAAT